jgi:PEP-CTERM motif
LLVSGSNSVQKVGGVDGTGTTQVNAGNSLTANHIIQGALIIGGTSTSAGLVAIDASDASGNPLAAAGGLALAGSAASNDPLAAGSLGSSNLLAAGGASSAGGSNLGGSIGSTSVGGTAAVPEPSTMLLAAMGAMACLAALRRRNNSARA